MKKIIIFDFNRTLFNPESEKLVQDAKLVLRSLKRCGFVLFLISRAGPSRKELINSLKIKKYFEQIIITPEKNKNDFEKLINKNIDCGLSFVVGDRVREEIFFGNLLGLQTIWVKKGKFANELPKKICEEPRHTIKKLKEILKIVC